MENREIHEIAIHRAGLFGRHTAISFWGVVAGTVVAAVCQLVFTVLGGAAGLSALLPSQSGRGVGIGLAVWSLFALCLSAFIGSVVASEVDRTISRSTGVLNGLLVWAFLSLIGATLVGGTLVKVLGGAFNFMGGAAQALVQSPAAENAPAAPEEAAPPGTGRDDIANALKNPENRERASEIATNAATGAAWGLWAAAACLILPLGASLLGGALGAGHRGMTLVRREEPLPPTRSGEPISPTRPPVPTA